VATTQIGAITGSDAPTRSIHQLGPARLAAAPAANQAATNMLWGAIDGGAPNSWSFLADAEIVGVVIFQSNVITAGTATISVSVNGVVNSQTVVIGASASTFVTFAQFATPIPVGLSSGSRFARVRVATDSSYAPTALQWGCYLVCRFKSLQ
jgi:hypothetical protein